MFEQLIKNLCNDYFEGTIDIYEEEQRFAYIGFGNIGACIYEQPDNSVEIIIEEQLEDKEYYEMENRQYKRLKPAYNFIRKHLG